MKYKMLTLLALMAISYTMLAQKVWNGSSSAIWSAPNNWGPTTGAPSSTETVTIPAGLARYPICTTSTTVASITTPATYTTTPILTINAGVTLTVNGAVTVTGNGNENILITGSFRPNSLSLEYGANVTTSGSGSLITTGNLNLGATNAGNSSFTIPTGTGGTLTVGGNINDYSTAGTSINSNSNAHPISVGGDLNVYSGTIVKSTNASGGISVTGAINVTSTGSVQSNGATLTAGSINMTGGSSGNVFTTSGTLLTGAITVSSSSAAAVYTGTGLLSASSIAVSGPGSVHTGTAALAVSGAITVSNGSVYTSSGSLTAGSITVSGGSVYSGGGNISTTSGNIDVSVGSISTDASVSSGADIILSSGSISANFASVTSVGDMNISGGTLSSGGDVTSSGGDINITSSPTIELTSGIGTLGGENVTISSGASTVTSLPFTIDCSSGDFTNNGNPLTNATTLQMDGSSANIIGATAIPVLEVNGANCTIDATTLVSVTDHVSVTSGTLTTGNTGSTSTYGLTLISDIAPGGNTAFVDNVGGTISGSVTVQRSVPDIGSPTTHYLSSPIYEGTSPFNYYTPGPIAISSSSSPTYNSSYTFQVPFLTPPSFFWYDETVGDPNLANAWIATQSPTIQTYYNQHYHFPWSGYGWTGAASNRKFPVGTGISARTESASQLYQWTGPINTGQIDVQVSWTDNSGTELSNVNDGWNLLGNPYPAPINIVDFYNDNSTYLTGLFGIWLNSGNEFEGTYQLYDVLSLTPSSSKSVVWDAGCSCYPISGGSWTDGIVSIGQGFYAKASSAASGTPTLSFFDTQRQSIGGVTNPSFFKTNKPEYDVLGLSIGTKGKKDAVAIVIDPQASDKYDMNRDGAKLFNPEGRHNIYTVKDNASLGIHKQAITKYETIIPLSLILASTDNPTFAINQRRSVDPNIKYYLEDRTENKIIPIDETFTYTFSTSDAKLSDRFYIHVINHTYKKDQTGANNNMTAYTDQSYLNIRFADMDGNTLNKVQLIDMLGRQQYTRDLEFFNGFAAIPAADMQAGVYLVTVTTASGIQTQKVSITK